MSVQVRDGGRYRLADGEVIGPMTKGWGDGEHPWSGDYGNRLFSDAFEQAASGKGKERHARGQRFEEQPILTIAQEEGAAFLTGQAKKKITEARGMVESGQFDAAERELLGAINYLAARIHLLRQEKAAGA